MFEFLGFVLMVGIILIFAILAIWFALGAFHQHLRNKGEGLGDAATRKDLAALEEKLVATFTTKH